MYYSDRPIESSKEDLLGRDGFATILAQSLINLKVTETFTIGLFGKWGSGKTSLVNMMIQKIEVLQQRMENNERFVIVHFEPWNFSSTDQLISQFFIRLSSEFKSKNDETLTGIADKIEEYSDVLSATEAIPYAGKVISSLGKMGIKVAADKLRKGENEKDIQKHKEFIVKLLKKQEQRVLIVIDDIDRLSNEQIRQVFQLIASVARFPNTLYLLVFDKDIVVEALKKVQEGEGEDYLEKIIQMPIQIPDANKNKIIRILCDRLDQIIFEYESISFLKDRWERMFHHCVDPFVDSLRDVNRLCNSLRFKLTAISTEVDFVDMVSISALEIALPMIYDWIKKNKALLTGDFDFLLASALRDRSQTEIYALYRDQILSLLSGDQEKTEIALSCLSRLFPHFGQEIGKIYEVANQEELRKGNHIAHPEKFDRYFNLDLDDDELRKSDIWKAVYMLDEKEFETNLLKLDAEGKSYEFLEEIRAIGNELPPERAKTIIIALINVSSKLDSTNSGVLFIRPASHAGFLIMDLLKLLESQERMYILTDCINNATPDSLSPLAVMLNRVELSYGRLAANGENKSDYKIVSLEELAQLEELFTQKAEEMLGSHQIFDFTDWVMVDYLLECFDPDYLKKYYEEAFKDNRNVALYLSSSVSEWTGSGTEYEVKNDYKKYLTEEQVSHAIDELRTSGDLFELPVEVQNRSAAFSLYLTGNKDYHDNIPLAEVEKCLQSWRDLVKKNKIC